jgi:methionyl-tRNA formyltransferase
MKIIFAGTPEFAAEALRALIEAGHEIEACSLSPIGRQVEVCIFKPAR